MIFNNNNYVDNNNYFRSNLKMHGITTMLICETLCVTFSLSLYWQAASAVLQNTTRKRLHCVYLSLWQNSGYRNNVFPPVRLTAAFQNYNIHITMILLFNTYCLHMLSGGRWIPNFSPYASF